MPVDYKIRTLRRLFGPFNFLEPRKTEKVVSAARQSGDKRDGARDKRDGARDSGENRRERLKMTKGGNGVPRAFFNEQLPRSMRNKAVGAQLFTVHLIEKQKMRVYYGAMRDEKFRKYVDEARRLRFNTDAALMRQLEMRLDTVLYRTGFAQTPMAGRQWIAHAQILINGEAIKMKSAALRAGDVLTIRDRHFSRALQAANEHAVTRKRLGLGASWIATGGGSEGLIPWLEVDRQGLSAALVRTPTDDELRGLQHAALFPFIRDAQLNPHAAMRAYR